MTVRAGINLSIAFSAALRKKGPHSAAVQFDVTFHYALTATAHPAPHHVDNPRRYTCCKETNEKRSFCTAPQHIARSIVPYTKRTCVRISKRIRGMTLSRRVTNECQLFECHVGMLRRNCLTAAAGAFSPFGQGWSRGATIQCNTVVTPIHRMYRTNFIMF